MDNLPEIMAKACPAGKHLGMWEPACRHAPATNPDRPMANLRQAKVNNWFTPAIRFRFS
jgi:hypothetical protein